MHQIIQLNSSTIKTIANGLEVCIMFYIVVYLTLVTNKAAQSLKHTGKCTNKAAQSLKHTGKCTNKAAQSLKHTGKCTTKISLLAENTISCV